MESYTWGQDPEFFGPQMYYRLTRIIEEVKRRKKQGLVLDAGCGDGMLSFRLGQSGYRVIAIDSSSACISYMSIKIAKLGLSKRVSAFTASLFYLPHNRN